MKNKTQRESILSGLHKCVRVRLGAGPKSERGASLMELAIVLPVMGLILLGVIDFGRAYYLSVEVQNAAEAGALYGTQNMTDIAGMQNTATGDMPDVTSSKDVSAYTATATNGCECSDGTQVTPSSEPAVSACPTATQPTCTAPATVINYVQVTTSATYNVWYHSWVIKGLPTSVQLNGSAKMR